MPGDHMDSKPTFLRVFVWTDRPCIAVRVRQVIAVDGHDIRLARRGVGDDDALGVQHQDSAAGRSELAQKARLRIDAPGLVDVLGERSCGMFDVGKQLGFERALELVAQDDVHARAVDEQGGPQDGRVDQREPGPDRDPPCSEVHAFRTYPAPRTVWIKREAPSASILLRR